MQPSLATEENITHILLENVKDNAYEDFILEKSTFLQWVKKTTNGGGLYDRRAFDDASIGGVAWSFDGAQASKSDMGGADWHITWRQLFALFSIDLYAAELASSNAHRLVDLVTSRLDNAAKRFRMVLNKACWGNGGGAIAQIQANNTTSLTLSSRADMFLFDRGMKISPSVDDGTGGAGITNDNWQEVATVNRQTRTITPVNTFNADWAVDSYVHLRGSYGLAIQGLPAWIPATAPGATLFNNVDRSIDDRRYGIIVEPSYFEGIGGLEDFLVSMATWCGEEGAETDAIWMNPRAAAFLRTQISQQVRYERYIGTNSAGKEIRNRDGAVVSFSQMMFSTDMGEIPIMTSRDIPYDLVYFLERDSIELNSIRELFRPLGFQGDNGKFRLHENANAAEARFGGYPQMIIASPHRNAVANIGSFLPAEV